jgi:proton glutamate symport protein
VLGVLAGVVLGQHTAVLEPLGTAYAMMLEIAVFPYLLCSLLHGPGRLTPATAGRVLAASWGLYLLLWALTLATIWLIARAIPPPPPIQLTAETATAGPDFLRLLIPANLFAALGGNYVPAVVVFAVVYGVAIQRVANKQSLFEIFEAVRVASVTIWGWIVRIAPLGVFALFANTAGTIQPDRLTALLLYVGLFLAGTCILAFVVLPGLIAALAPVGYREIMRELQPALVLAAVTTLSVAALPFVQRAAERIAQQAGCHKDNETGNVIQTSLSIGYVLAQLGNYFVYLLILYACYAYDTRLGVTQALLLLVMTLLSCLGSPTATVDAVAFLAHWLRLPDGVTELWLETWTITRYGQVLLSVMGFGVVTILIPLIYHRAVKPRPGPALLDVGGMLLIAAIAIAGVVLRPTLFPANRNAILAYRLDPELARGLLVTLHRPPPGDQAVEGPGRDPTLLAIQNSGTLRVGYNPSVIPFSYWNDKGDLVGFDIAYAYRLARDLNVKLELIPFAWPTLARDLTECRFDLAVSGIYVTDDRLQTLTISRSYYQSPVALIVRADRASHFLDRDEIAAMPNLRLAVFDDPVLVPMLRRLFPGATIKVLPSYDHLAELGDEVDGAIWTLQQAGAWAAAHPGYTAVGPSNMGSPILIAYLLPPGADSFRQYLDQWLELKASDGFRQAQIDYWIKGKPRAERKPRWNLLDALAGASH